MQISIGVSLEDFCKKSRGLVLHPAVLLATVYVCFSMSVLVPGGYLEEFQFVSRFVINLFIGSFYLLMMALFLPTFLWHGMSRNIPWLYINLVFYFPVSIISSAFVIYISGGVFELTRILYYCVALGLQIFLAILVVLFVIRVDIDKIFTHGERKLPIFKPIEIASCGLQQYLSENHRGRIKYLKAEGQYILVETDSGKELIRMSLKEAVSLVQKDSGLQIHRSYWLHKGEIVEFQFKNGNPKVLTKKGDLLPVSRSSVENVRAALV